jgi:hypothetical protein
VCVWWWENVYLGISRDLSEEREGNIDGHLWNVRNLFFCVLHRQWVIVRNNKKVGVAVFSVEI